MLKIIFYIRIKVLLIIPLILLSLYSLCNADDYDSLLAARPPLTGAINRFNYNYELQVVFIGDLYPGDTGWPWIPPYVPNSPERAYLTFPLDSLFIPATSTIDSIKLRLAIVEMVGNDCWGEWPIWDISGGDTIKLCIDHIDFGNYLDVGDWTAGDPGNPQTLDSKFTFITLNNYNPQTYYVHVDVTNAVLGDFENGRNKSQFRIRFEIDTDMDSLYDYIAISKYFPNPQYYPTLLFYINDSTSVDDEYEILENTNISIENYPNPFPISTTIRLSLPENINKYNLSIYNIKGQLVKQFIIPNSKFLINEVEWDGKDENGEPVPTGIYLYMLSDGENSITKKMILLR